MSDIDSNDFSSSELYRFRHSLAHVLAQAVKQEYPNVKLGFGPPTDNGFYYDFDFGDDVLADSKLKKIEKRMKKIISKGQIFEREDLSFDQALEKVSGLDEQYKVENIKNLKERGVEVFSFYGNGPFLDLCEGPHVENTKDLPTDSFKLDKVAGAYWLGDEKNKMLTRVYALAFLTKDELDAFIKRREIAEQFDHKKLGKDLELFQISDMVGKGLPLWLPNGTIIREAIEDYAKEVERKAGYLRVSTPHITKQDLFLQSQHLPAYEDSMFPPILCENEETGHQDKYYLKPMNCPHHHLIYGNRIRSYRELPLRLAEYGTCYRYEQSGELSGLLRVRCFTMNDAHLYCAADQIEGEIRSILQMYQEFYDTFRLNNYTFRLSIRGKDNKDNPKFRGDDAMWSKGETILEKMLKELNIPFYVGEGEAAFYGPKIDIQFRNLMGREETVSTVQVDFLAAENFDLKYTDQDGNEVRPVVIHRAPLSTHERFISFLIEYYGGAFPTWCSPTQVCIIPVNETCLEYCDSLRKSLHDSDVRVLLDDSSASFGKKIRANTVKKTPIILIVGNNEVGATEVTVRRYGEDEQLTVSKDSFVAELLEEIKQRKNFREPMGSLI